MRNIAILGSTGSIGKNALRVVENLQNEFSILSLSCFQDAQLLSEQALKFHPRVVNILDETKIPLLSQSLKGSGIEISSGTDALCELAQMQGVDLVLNAIMGSAGFPPTLAAARNGKRIALANKETLVSYGHIIMREIAEHGAELIPVDSEHSAIFQCIQGKGRQSIKRIILTTSGGPFRNRPNLKGVTIEETLNHPVWSMGKKISVNSATMMNKALEIIEAHFLFGVPADKITVIIHPQCIVHSAVEFEDGSIIAQLSHPDMTLPIQYALTFPQRRPSITKSLDFSDLPGLTFEPALPDRFPALSLAYRAIDMGGTATSVLNGANELLVDAFLNEEISLDLIPSIVSHVLDAHHPIKEPSIKDIQKAEEWAYKKTKQYIADKERT
jgi:1-deoxy-D-xylulose-5-phosphate reductoisomerase